MEVASKKLIVCQRSHLGGKKDLNSTSSTTNMATAEEKLNNAVALLNDILPSPQRNTDKDIVPSPNSRTEKGSSYEAYLKEREQGWKLLRGTSSLRPVDKVPVGTRTPVHQRHRHGL